MMNNEALIKPDRFPQKGWDSLNDTQKRNTMNIYAKTKNSFCWNSDGSKTTFDVSTGKPLTNLQTLDESTASQFVDLIVTRRKCENNIYENVMTETEKNEGRPVAADSLRVLQNFHNVIVNGMNAESADSVEEYVRPQFNELLEMIQLVKAK
jgi:hypothetical protein